MTTASARKGAATRARQTHAARQYEEQRRRDANYRAACELAGLLHKLYQKDELPFGTITVDGR